MRTTFTIVLLLSIFCYGPAFAQSETSQAQTFASRLREVEPQLGYSTQLKNPHKGEIAILGLQLDEMRDRYTTDLQLNSEGLISADRLKIARAAYERVQVQLAAKEKKIDETLKAIDTERSLAESMARDYRTQIAANGELPL